MTNINANIADSKAFPMWPIPSSAETELYDAGRKSRAFLAYAKRVRVTMWDGSERHPRLRDCRAVFFGAQFNMPVAVSL